MASFGLWIESLMEIQNVKKIPEILTCINMVALNEYMSADRDTLHSLAIIKPHGQKMEQKTLSDILCKTTCSAGLATMRTWIMQPSCNIETINDRLNTVDCILRARKDTIGAPSLIRHCLQNIRNIHSTLQSLRMGNFGPNIWRHLRDYATKAQKMNDIITSHIELMKCSAFAGYANVYHAQAVQQLKEQIETVLDFDVNSKNVSIKHGFDKDLDHYLARYEQLETTLESIAEEMTELMGTPILIGYFPQMGYLAFSEKGEITRPEFELVFTMDSVAYHKTPQMRDMDRSFGDIALLVTDKQSEILFALKERVMPLTKTLAELYPFIGEIDALLTFSRVALANKMCKPEMTACTDLEIVDGFNPLVDAKKYVRNTYQFANNKVNVLTGPNFSGKSTLLVQTGLIVFLSHMGCYVPANSAKIGVVDKLLTRLASLETVSRNQSTFMRDCVQMGKCINKLSSKSLVLVDEFGKGTDPIDGQAMLSSVIHYYTTLSFTPRVFIATHMVEVFKNGLVDKSKLSHFQMEVVVEKDPTSFCVSGSYKYKVKPGMCTDSFGILCMEKSGVDTDTVARAVEIHKMLTKNVPLSSTTRKLQLETAVELLLEMELAERICPGESRNPSLAATRAQISTVVNKVQY